MDLHERIESILSQFVAAEQSLQDFKQEYGARKFTLEAGAKAHEKRLAKLLQTACEKLRRERDRLAELDPVFNQADGKIPHHAQLILPSLSNHRPP